MPKRNLFPDCVLPGCANLVAHHGDVCADCTTAFGTMLRPGAPRLTAAQIHRRDAEVRASYTAQLTLGAS